MSTPAEQTVFPDPASTAKRTKIVATVGPSSEPRPMLERLVAAGVDVFRLNFSHGSHEGHEARIKAIREISEAAGRPLGILADLSGPKIRIGNVEGGEIMIKPGQRVTFTPEKTAGDRFRYYISFEDLASVAQKGQRVLLDDGQLDMVVTEIDGRDVHCEVVTGGPLKPRKGVNLPQTRLPIPALTEKDRADLAFALRQGVDLVALSFVRSEPDLALARSVMEKCGRVVPLFAKIEMMEAVENLGEILRSADGAMVARGDLGVEIPFERVAPVQKEICRICNSLARPVIVATQMLDSMIRNPRPTRAEVTDVFNAILDGADAVMLSGETAAGEYPVEAVETMSRIALQAEKMHDRRNIIPIAEDGRDRISELVSRMAAQAATDLRLDAIVVPTASGSTARRVSRYRPPCPVLAASINESSVNAMCISYGVYPRYKRAATEAEEEVHGQEGAQTRIIIELFKEMGFLREGMRIAILAGLPLHVPGTTNFLRIVDVE